MQIFLNLTIGCVFVIIFDMGVVVVSRIGGMIAQLVQDSAYSSSCLMSDALIIIAYDACMVTCNGSKGFVITGFI